LAQKECPSKNVRGLKAVGFHVSHLLSVLDFFGEIRYKKKAVSKGYRLLEPSLGHQLRPAKVMKLMALFPAELPALKKLSRKILRK
jgi:hypothetical protein